MAKFGFSWSWRRASGLSAAKGRASRAIGVPLTRSGRERKAGRMVVNSLAFVPERATRERPAGNAFDRLVWGVLKRAVLVVLAMILLGATMQYFNPK